MPLMNWKSEVVVVKQSGASFISLFVGLLTVVVPMMIYFILYPSTPYVLLSILAATVIVCSILIHLHILKHSKRLFQRL